MSAMNHTPGEWSLDLSDMAIYNEIGTGICKINRQAKKAGVDDLEKTGPSIETMGNAALICAAPELIIRLYNLINDAKTVLLDLGTHVATDDVNSNGLLLSLTQAEETLKKVIQ